MICRLDLQICRNNSDWCGNSNFRDYNFRIYSERVNLKMAKKIIRKTWKVERMSLVELTPASYNPRKMSVGAYQGMGKSIDRFGMLIPIVWNKRSGNIVGGHQRYRFLVEQGETETDVVVVDFDDNEEVALNIALNNKFLRGEFTPDVVGLLKKSEIRIGSAFDDIGLAEMLREMSRKFAAELKKKDGSSDGSSPKPPIPPRPKSPGSSGQVPEADAVITCPECRSRFRMKDNDVVFDGRTVEK